MALTLVVEDGSGLTNANSYISVADATSYFDGHLYSSEWDDASNTQRETALVMASRLLDEWIDWSGARATENQGLRWPRYNTYDRDGYALDSNIVPPFLEVATAEQALYLLRSDLTVAPDTQGYKELQVGSLKLVIDKADRDKVGVIPDAVLVMVEPYGSIRNRSGSGVAKLVRA